MPSGYAVPDVSRPSVSRWMDGHQGRAMRSRDRMDVGAAQQHARTACRAYSGADAFAWAHGVHQP